ncbi:MAG: MATE family efflux transporter [Lachnospiraceae bacterium]|nr:MATE family efflux transporter [Lachnospiraceae bacterium]
MDRQLTSGSVTGNLIRFSVPYLIACFLQTFYGLADLFITGLFNGAAVITAVAVGSQIMHMVTVVIAGMVMGSTVAIARAAGAGKDREAGAAVASSALVFSVIALLSAALLLILEGALLRCLATPAEAYPDAFRYCRITFAGVPAIVAFNVISGIFRGVGDTRRPMIIVAVTGVINVVLDFLLIGPMHLGAGGAAAATVASQAISVVIAAAVLKRTGAGIGIAFKDMRPDRDILFGILRVGFPVALQDGFIQVSFLMITAIANSRGVNVAAAVGIVEKIISFLFLVPSAMLSAVSAIAAQNAGAGEHRRAVRTLWSAVSVCVVFGTAVFVLCQFFAGPFVSLFTRSEPEVVRLGAQYLRSYSADCIFAGIQFCFSGFFCAYEKAFYSFLHNIISIILVRVPGAYLASERFPDTLFPMGLAAPAGSLLSSVICIVIFCTVFRGIIKRTEGAV